MKSRKSLGDIVQSEAQPQKKFSIGSTIGYTIWGSLAFGGIFLIGRKMIKNARSDNEQDKSFEDGTAANYAKQVKMALHNDGWYGADTVALRNVLMQIPSQDDYQKVIKSYDKQNGGNMEADMSSELKTTELNEMNAIISAKPKKTGDTVDASVQYTQWANRINAALMKTWGFFSDPDTDALKAVFYEIPKQSDYINVGAAYQIAYHTTMDADMQSKLHSWDYTTVTAIIQSKPIS